MDTKSLIVRNIIICKMRSGLDKYTAIALTRQELATLGVNVKEIVPDAVRDLKKFLRNTKLEGFS